MRLIRLTRPFLVSVILLLSAGCAPDAETKDNPALNQTAVMTLTDANFAREVLERSQPVLVDFWAGWCRPCLEMKPMIRELAEAYAGRVTIGELNVEGNAFTAQKYGVTDLPTLLLFQDGKLAARLDGRPTKEDIIRLLDSALTSALSSSSADVISCASKSSALSHLRIRVDGF